MQDRGTFRYHSGAVHGIAVSTDQRFLVTGSADKTVAVFDLLNGELYHVFKGHRALVSATAVDPKNNVWAASASHDGTVKIWQVENIRSEFPTGHAGKVFQCALSPDCKFVATASSDGFVKVRVSILLTCCNSKFNSDVGYGLHGNVAQYRRPSWRSQRLRGITRQQDHRFGRARCQHQIVGHY